MWSGIRSRCGVAEILRPDRCKYLPQPATLPLPETTSTLWPATRALRELGRDFALTRRKRGISTKDIASRLFVSRAALWRMEHGDPTVAVGTVATAAFILQCMIASRIWRFRRQTHSLSAMTSGVHLSAFAARDQDVHIEWAGETHLAGWSTPLSIANRV